MSRDLALKLVLAVLASLVAIALCEVAVRIAVPQTLGLWRTTRDGIVTLRPGLEDYRSPIGTRVNTNALGMRDSTRAPEKEKGTLRVLVLGDSFMEALQVEVADSFSNVLERELRQATGRRIEVMTGGVSGWGTDDELTWYARHGVAFDPDLVLVAMTLHNDVSDNLEMEFHTFADGQLVGRPEQMLPWSRYVALWGKGLLAAHSHLYRFVTGRLSRGEVLSRSEALAKDVDEVLSPRSAGRMSGGWAMTLALLDAFRAETARHGAALAVVLIPIGVQVEEPDAAALGAPPQETMRRWGERVGVPVFDLLPAFRDWKARNTGMLYLPRDGHWNTAGHAIAAAEVARALVSSDTLKE